ncbi:MAG TPA: type II toxin-antitoxin system VapC family toxin [Thermoflexia bacterium]|nr:type II toxin-antitoxin system VapC family toxin [Thermoflexia bacterium]
MVNAPTHLIDTNIMISWLTARYPQVQQHIAQLDSRYIFVSAITVAELYFGAHNSARPLENWTRETHYGKSNPSVIYDVGRHNSR